MSDIILKEQKAEKVENLIYQIRDVQVMLGSKIFVTKSNVRIITCYNIGNSISVFHK